MPPSPQPVPALTFEEPHVSDPDLERRAVAAVRALAEGGSATAPLRNLLSMADQIPREPGAVRVLRVAIRTLPDAVHDADLARPGEFHALFQLMLGLGVDPTGLSDHLEVGIATIARYAAGTSAPSTVHARRGALIETVRMLEQGLRDGELQCLNHLRA
jgi:hypothetical protein